MEYNFLNLSDADFEDLARDLIGRELGVRFEAFCAGPDGGLDGRHASTSSIMVLQAKRYGRSGYSSLKSAMRRARPIIEALPKLTRYLLVTSCPLTPNNKSELSEVIGPILTGEEDIFGPDDLNSLLRKFPEIEKAHIKLWLSSAAMLERIIAAGSFAFNQMTEDEIAKKVEVYAPNPSFEKARDILEKEHVLVISGPPGVGKTTLAEMLAFFYMSQEWELVAIRSLDDGFAALNDHKRQIFFFDDFLGTVALDVASLSKKDAEIARFIKRVARSPNARFILTTRAYILEEARRSSEALSAPKLEMLRYTLDVGIYTRRIRARILFNHLLASELQTEFLLAFVSSALLFDIIDHKNYNPRVVEWMTDAQYVSDVSPNDYPSRFLEALNNPSRVWDTAFRTHIHFRCQHLLIALYFSADNGVQPEVLRKTYDGIHSAFCKHLGNNRAFDDFENAVRTLEGGFITIGPAGITFVNPSVRDYLREYLVDFDQLLSIAQAAEHDFCARNVWQHALSLDLPRSHLAALASKLAENANVFMSPATQGLSSTDRLKLLLVWWETCPQDSLVTLLHETANAGRFSAWKEGRDLIHLIGRLKGDGASLPFATLLALELELAVLDLIQFGVGPDDLETISDAVEERDAFICSELKSAIAGAIEDEFDYVDDYIRDIDSDSTLADYAASLSKLADRVGLGGSKVSRAMRSIQDRMEALESETEVASSPVIRVPNRREVYSNQDVKQLFALLVARPEA